MRVKCKELFEKGLLYMKSAAIIFLMFLSSYALGCITLYVNDCAIVDDNGDLFTFSNPYEIQIYKESVDK